MATNKWVSLPYPYNHKPSYWDSDSEDESIDYPSSDDESEDEEEVPRMTNEALLTQMLADIAEEESPPPKESTPTQRSQELRKEILKILKR